MNLVRHRVAHIIFLLLFSGLFPRTLTARSLDEQYTVSAIFITGVLNNKDLYKKIYRVSKGMPFKKDEHHDGIEAIQSYFKNNGYFRVTIHDTLRYDDKNNTVKISLHIVPGPLYTIHSVSCLVDQDCKSILLEDIIKKLQKKLDRRLNNTPCMQEVIDNQALMMSTYFVKKGYLFAHIEMERIYDDDAATVDLIFTCGLKHKKQYVFEGNNAFNNDTLYRLCAEFGKALLIIPPVVLVQELEDFYKKNGFFDAAISYHEDDSVVTFTIEEGCKAFIESVDIKGLSDDINNPCRLFFLSHGHSFYDSQKIAQSLQECMVYAVKQGYGYISFINDEMIKQPSGNYKLVLSFNQGSSISLDAISATDFHDMIALLYDQRWCKKYAPYYRMHTMSLAPLPNVDITDISRMKRFLQKQLHDNSYLYTHVSHQFVDNNGSSELQWVFTGSKFPVRFGHTLIQGSCILSDSVIGKALMYKKGDLWDKKKIDETAAFLRSCNVFDSVTVFPENIMQQEEYKTMLIQVQDSDPFELKTRIGFQGVGTNLTWQGGATYKCGGTFLWKNPFNYCDIASLNIDITRFFRYVTLMYQVPFIGEFPIKQHYKIYSNRYNQPVVLGSQEILYHFSQNGFLWSLSSHNKSRQWGFTSGMEWMRMSHISEKLSDAIDFNTAFINKHIPYFFLEPSFYIGDIDNRLDPLIGWYCMISSKALVPLTVHKSASLKFFFEQGSYIPLHKKKHIVLAIRCRMGTIFYQRFSSIMPPERFYLGGAYSLRGYEPDLAPPLNFYRNSSQEVIVVPTGGKTMMNTNVELRFAIFRSFGGAVFTDIGILTQRACTDIQAPDIIGASGFGFRWNTPVGPLRFDIGWKWKQFPGNQAFYNQAPYAWFLTLGNAF